MSKFHVNSKGEVKPCRATVRECRYGDNNHFNSVSDAEKHIASSNPNVLNGVKKNSFSVKNLLKINKPIKVERSVKVNSDGSSTVSFVNSKKNELHREDGPALVKYDSENNLQYEYYFKHGEKHRDDDLPAVIHYGKNGKIRVKEYYKDGYPNREGKPFKIEYDSRGQLSSTSHYSVIDGEKVQVTRHNDGKYTHVYQEWVDGKVGALHREGDKPAVIKYYADGTVRSEFYYKNNVPYRENNGPTVVHYDSTGKIIKTEN